MYEILKLFFFLISQLTMIIINLHTMTGPWSDRFATFKPEDVATVQQGQERK